MLAAIISDTVRYAQARWCEKYACGSYLRRHYAPNAQERWLCFALLCFDIQEVRMACKNGLFDAVDEIESKMGIQNDFIRGSADPFLLGACLFHCLYSCAGIVMSNEENALQRTSKDSRGRAKSAKGPVMTVLVPQI